MLRLILVSTAAALMLGCQSTAAPAGPQAASNPAQPGPVGGSASATATVTPPVASARPEGQTGLVFLQDMALGLKEREIKDAVFYRVVGKGVSETGMKPWSEMKLGDETWTAWYFDPADGKSYKAIPGSGMRAIMALETDPAKQYKPGYKLDLSAIATDSPEAVKVTMKPSGGGDLTLLSPQEFLAQQAGEKNPPTAVHPVWVVPSTLNTGATGNVYVDAATGVVVK